MSDLEVSYAQKVKEELATNTYSLERLRSLLSAFTRINGTLLINNGQTSLLLKTENAKIAKFLYSSFGELYGILPHLHYLRKLRLNKKTSFELTIDEEIEYILGDLEINFLEGKISKNMVYNDELISAYFVGAFLSAGSVNSPTSSNYHLEIALNEENYAKWFRKLFLRYRGGSFNIKEIKRRDKYVLYLKKSDQIVDFLILLGATDSALMFEDIRMDRDFASIGNRLQILDKANLSKAISSAKRQIDDILLLDEKVGLDSLTNKKLALLLRLRLEHDDASFSELAKYLSEKTGENVSRSNINHLFRTLKELVKPYKENK